MTDSLKLLNASNAYNLARDQKVTADKMDQLSKALDGKNEVNESAFGTLVSQSIDKASSTISNSEAIAAKALVDEASLADLATAVTDAELTLRTVVSVRDRIISAYQEIIKMPI